jgi:cytochrome b subunit of formate dehydrogenase
MATLKTFPVLFVAFWALVAVAVGTFAVFLPHTFMWGLREFLGRKEEGTPKKREKIKRFTPFQRLFHVLLMLSFITQGTTGLSRMYIETRWGSSLASFFGGYQGALTVHRWAGLFMLVLFSVHVLYVLANVNWRRFPKSVYGPDSLLPRLEDLFQSVQHVGWFLGMAKPPKFDRWGYWEKFDYWAVFWGMVIIGGTGLILFDSVLSGRFMPGWGLNVALWVHRIEAILAMAHVFIIHFFIGHLRRHNFPMDLAMFEGSVDLEKTRHEKPAWIARVEGAGKLEAIMAKEASPVLRIIYYLFGLTAVAFCVFLLIGGIINSTSITW